MTNLRKPRSDGQRTIRKLRAAAIDVFLSRGLDAPLEDIAKAAGVSIGTLYYRFGSRDGLIDDVIPGIIESKVEQLVTQVTTMRTPRQRLEGFIRKVTELQTNDPVFNDVILRRHPDAEALVEVCNQVRAFGRTLVLDALADGSLKQDF